MHDLTPKIDHTRDQHEVEMKEASSEMKGSTTSVLENRCVRQRIREKIPKQYVLLGIPVGEQGQQTLRANR